MTDKDFLKWLHERLVHQHKENPMYDYMHRLRAIINNIDSEKRSPDSKTNSLDELQKENSCNS